MASFRLLAKKNGVSPYNQMWEACRNDPCLVGIAKDWKNTGKSRFGTIRIEDMTIDFVRRTPSIYEMLLDKPARFVLDLDEFSGPQEDQERKVQETIDIFVRAFHQKLECVVNQEDILVMSNSVQTKFSKHILFNKVFDDRCTSMKHFIEQVWLDNPDMLKPDFSIYSRTRQFRLPGSAKKNDPNRFLVLPAGRHLHEGLVQIYSEEQPTELLHYEEKLKDPETGKTLKKLDRQIYIYNEMFPKKWKPVLHGLTPSDLLKCIFPNCQYGCEVAYLWSFIRSGGTFEDWGTHMVQACVEPRRQRRRNRAQWDKQVQKTVHKYGYGPRFL